MVGAPVEDTISTMQLVTRGIPSRYPNIKIINSHLGGALPMLLQRADNQYAWEYPDTPELPSVAARRMWYDTVGHVHVPALRSAVESFGADRLLLGTDFPYEAGDIIVRAIDYIPASGIPADQAKAILAQRHETTGNRIRPEPVSTFDPTAAIQTWSAIRLGYIRSPSMANQGTRFGGRYYNPCVARRFVSRSPRSCTRRSWPVQNDHSGPVTTAPPVGLPPRTADLAPWAPSSANHGS